MSFNITIQDIECIEKAIDEGGKVWDNLLLASFKTRLKNHLLSGLNHNCCYCRSPLDGEFNLVIDIEHVLPKSKFKEFTFSLFNLSVSCKRCNMKIKRNNTDFVIDDTKIRRTPNDSSLYKFIHPNFDEYYKHLNYTVKIENDIKLIKYSPVNNSDKGKYTYDYFKLKQLEVDSLNEAQGRKSSKPEISNVISDDLAERLKEAVKKL